MKLLLFKRPDSLKYVAAIPIKHDKSFAGL